MDNQGNLYEFKTNETKIEKENELQQKLIELSQREHKTLSSYPREERQRVLEQMRSPKARAKERARKKIAKASRQRNRR